MQWTDPSIEQSKVRLFFGSMLLGTELSLCDLICLALDPALQKIMLGFSVLSMLLTFFVFLTYAVFPEKRKQIFVLAFNTMIFVIAVLFFTNSVGNNTTK